MAAPELRVSLAPRTRVTIGVVVAAALVTAALVSHGVTREGVVDAALCAVLVWLSVIDITEHRLPNSITIPAAAGFLAARLALFSDRATEWIVAGLGAFAVLLVMALIYPAGLGMGDVKLALLLGFALGYDVVAALVLGFLAVLPVSIALLIRYGSAGRRATFPLGPCLALGAVVVALL